MKKYIVCFVFLAFCSCKDNGKSILKTNNLASDYKPLTSSMISEINFTDILLDENAKLDAQNWTSYKSLAQALSEIKELNYDFFKSDNIEFDTTFKELNTNIPEAFNSQSVKARLLVLQTRLYRFKDELSFNPTLNTSHTVFIKEIFVAFSNLNLQINKKLEKEAQVIIKTE
jgi:hypothetical protein